MRGKKTKKAKELKLGELFSSGWDIYKNNFWLIALITLIIYIPINIILNLAAPVEGIESLQMYVRIANILDFLLGVIAVMAIAYAVDRIVAGKKPKLWESFKSALLVWDKAILTSLLASLILLGLYVLLIIPGIIWSVYYTFFIYAVILKKLKYKTALNYSKGLVRGRWWRVLGISIIVSVGISVAAGIVSGIAAFAGTLATNIIADCLFDIIYALREVIMVVFFINLAKIGPK
jgi:hypothetical protein